MAKAGDEVVRILRAYKDEIIDEATALKRIGEKYSHLDEEHILVLQHETNEIARVHTQLFAEQNVILKGVATSLEALAIKNKKGSK